MHFGENQLSRSLIGLSPLPTAHPPGFQPWWVRASTTSYSRFTLAMGRSLRFGSTPRDYSALFRLAFATATPQQVNLATKHNSQAHSSKGTPSPNKSALTACKHTVSGTLSLPSRGTFHLSLTVLVRYRSSGSIQAYRVVPADSQQIPRARCYSGVQTHSMCDAFAYGALTHYGNPFQRSSANTTHHHHRLGRAHTVASHNPHTATPAGLTQHRFSQNPLSLATTHGITVVFSSCGY